MTKHIYLFLVLALATGCFHLPEKNEAKPAAKPAEHHALIAPEQVRETNAHAIADALEAEVKSDETTSPKPEEPKAPARK